MKDLPEFKHRSRETVLTFISAMLTNERISKQTHLKALNSYPDGHYRAIFDPAYFALPPDQTQPSKSQWNTLKKRLKRHEPTIFIFKEHGEIEQEGRCFYVDFGFFAH
ncbi:MAG: hypothetical protein H6671_17790 [Anaerolineaceae bacterium]|nr:hypothetical protein [Anaerolineaceae bacterium]